MSWRVLIAFLVLTMAGAAMGGVALGNWLVDQAPGVAGDGTTSTAKAPEQVLDATGRPLANVAPQPLVDGSLGRPPLPPSPSWQLEGISLFDTVLDPMVVLAKGDQAFTVSDRLSEAGSGLAQGPDDVATVDVTSSQAQTQQAAAPQRVASEKQTEDPTDANWRMQLTDAVKACDDVGFFSRPDCIQRARKKFCEPNQAWGRDELCPSPNAW